MTLVRDEWAAVDLTREIFVRVHDHLTELHDPTKPSSWMYRMVHNLCQDHFRAAGKLLNKHSDHEEREITGEESAEKQFEQVHVGPCVPEEIDRLPESFREVIILADLKDFSGREIANLRGIMVENVKVCLYRARRMLKEFL